MTSVGGNLQSAGAGAFGGHNNPAPAQFTAGAVGFGPAWQDDATTLQELYDKACQSIVRLECEKSELEAEVALLQEQARIMARELDAYRDAACAESCREKEFADRASGNPWTNI